MFGIETFPDAASVSSAVVFGTCSFQCVTSGTVLASSITGSLRKRVTSITQSGTGVFTVVMAKGFVFKALPIIEVSNTCADVTGTNSFYAVLTGVPTQTSGVLTFVLQALSAATTAFAVPATAGNRIQFSIEGVNESDVGI